MSLYAFSAQAWTPDPSQKLETELARQLDKKPNGGIFHPVTKNPGCAFTRQAVIGARMNRRVFEKFIYLHDCFRMGLYS